MKKLTCPLVLAALAFLPAEGRTQSAAAGDRATLDALVREVRLLRQAVERQAATAVRSQLLVSQLAVQYQRVARAQDAVDRVAEEVDAALRRQDQVREALSQQQRILADVIEEPRRSELERKTETLKAQLVDRDREVFRLRTRRSQAERSLDAEQQLYGELERSLNSLDRQLQRLGS